MQAFVNMGRLHNIFSHTYMLGMDNMWPRARGWAKALQNMQNY
jgi:hypothetical protein